MVDRIEMYDGRWACVMDILAGKEIRELRVE